MPIHTKPEPTIESKGIENLMFNIAGCIGYYGFPLPPNNCNTCPAEIVKICKDSVMTTLKIDIPANLFTEIQKTCRRGQTIDSRIQELIIKGLKTRESTLDTKTLSMSKPKTPK
jgi:hypothetical protein